MTPWLICLYALILVDVSPLKPKNPPQTAKSNQQAQSQQAPIQSAVAQSMHDDQSGEERAHKAPVPPQDADKWVVRGFWVNAGLLGITSAIAVATILQSRAALKQSGHIVASERAWLICKMDNPPLPPDGPYMFAGVPKITNHGHSPAFVFQIGNSAVMLNKEELLPDAAIYKDKNVFRFEGRGVPIAPDGQVGRYVMSSGFEKATDVLSERRVLWVHGYVKYRTVFSDEVRETRYCFRCIPSALPGLANTFAIDGPSAYNQAD